MAQSDITRSGSVFHRLGKGVVRWPLLVVVFWVALAAVPLLTLPPLAEIVGRHKATPLPYDAPTMVTTRDMADAFHETGSDNVLLVVLTNEEGFGPADEQTYRRVIDKVRAETSDVTAVQDFLGTPQLREILQSKDNKAWNIPVTLAGDLGSPQARNPYIRVTDVVHETVAGTTLTANVTGPAATVADIAEVGERDLHLIELGTGVLVLLILLIVYRNVVTMLLPLITIAISLATAQGALAGLAELGLRI